MTKDLTGIVAVTGAVGRSDAVQVQLDLLRMPDEVRRKRMVLLLGQESDLRQHQRFTIA